MPSRGAIGDALGAPVEFLSWQRIREVYGPDGVTSVVLGPRGKAQITDDTQMTLFTVEGLIRASVGESDPPVRGVPCLPAMAGHPAARGATRPAGRMARLTAMAVRPAGTRQRLTGSICGNLLGAWHGEAALPPDWLADLEGRDTILALADDLVADYAEYTEGHRVHGRYPGS